jgi:hypothetical protein
MENTTKHTTTGAAAQHTPGHVIPPGYEVVRAYTMRNGRDVPDGWDVLFHGEWGNRYRTKRGAVEAIAKATGSAE